MVCLLVLYQYSAGLLWITDKSVTFLSVLAFMGGLGFVLFCFFKGTYLFIGCVRTPAVKIGTIKYVELPIVATPCE